MSDVAKTYDILGWIAPSVLSMKMLYQQLWKRGIGWDDVVPPELEAQHKLWKEQLPMLTQKQLPRCYFLKDAPRVSTQLHGFSDASEKAWGAVVYVRATYEHHPPTVALVTAKTKVIKPETSTIPRKELCGALMLAKLLNVVGTALGIPPDQFYGWTDSSIVLAWLDGGPRDLDVFCSNRVRAILQLTTPHSWKHVPTLQNPADCASRGMMPQELLAHSLWWEGPTWLQSDPVETPWQPPRRALPAIEKRLVHTSVPVPSQWIEGRYESYHKCILITAWCLRYIHRYLYRLRQKKPPEAQPIRMTSVELAAAEHRLVKLSLARSFPKDIQQLLSRSQSWLTAHSRLCHPSWTKSCFSEWEAGWPILLYHILNNTHSLSAAKTAWSYYCLIICIAVLGTVAPPSFYVLQVQDSTLWEPELSAGQSASSVLLAEEQPLSHYLITWLISLLKE